MRIEKPIAGRWLAAVLLPLLSACGPSTEGVGGEGKVGDLLPLGAYQDGLITFYDATGAGNCSYDPSPGDLDVAAMNIGQYQDSAVCGSCVDIEGPKGNLRVRIVDSCPDCPDKGHLDLSRSAVAKIANATTLERGEHAAVAAGGEHDQVAGDERGPAVPPAEAGPGDRVHPAAQFLD